MKKIIVFLMIFNFIFGQSFFIKAFALENTFFVVTAYYSPLPDQKYYFKGSYEADVILNGEGNYGASGKKVFPGMLAAPKTYKFGTKIYLEGIGVGEVSDRGGAIVSASGSDNRGYDYDRIDIWMGYGEEGLKRALMWGKKTITGAVLEENSQNTIVLENLPQISQKALENFVKSEQNSSSGQIISNNNNNIFSKNIGEESQIDDVKKLQVLFRDINLYTGEIDGDYQNFKKYILDYQLKNKIVIDTNSVGAGYFGPKTRQQFQIDYANISKEIALKQKEKQDLINSQKQKVDQIISKIGDPQYGKSGQNIKLLQKTLKVLGHFNKKENLYFGDTTKKSLIAFQIQTKIIKDEKDLGAGYFGPKTKQAIKTELYKKVEESIK